MLRSAAMADGIADAINGRQVLDFQTASFDALQQKKPVRKVRVDQNVQVRELNQKRSMANPGDCDLTMRKFWKLRPETFARAFR